jgi:hypothetical protein
MSKRDKAEPQAAATVPVPVPFHERAPEDRLAHIYAKLGVKGDADPILAISTLQGAFGTPELRKPLARITDAIANKIQGEPRDANEPIDDTVIRVLNRVKDLLSERWRQEQVYPAVSDDRLSPDEWRGKLAKATRDATQAMAAGEAGEYDARRRFVQVGALAIAAIESLDRARARRAAEDVASEG